MEARGVLGAENGGLELFIGNETIELGKKEFTGNKLTIIEKILNSILNNLVFFSKDSIISPPFFTWIIFIGGFPTNFATKRDFGFL